MIKSQLLYTFYFIFLGFSAISQNKDYPSPPGTIKLSENLFIDVAPVDNLMFIEYLDMRNHLSNKKLDSILNISNNYGLITSDILKNIRSTSDKPDSLFVFVFNNKNDYLRHPKFSKYPVINISKAEAIDFCKWRTKMVLLHYAMDSKTEKERLQLPKNIIYRLTTSKEFNKAIDKFGFSKGIKPDSKDISFLVYRNEYKKKYKKAIFIKNNLSEYVSDSISVGTNWANKKPLKTANNFTSFRCICEIID